MNIVEIGDQGSLDELNAPSPKGAGGAGLLLPMGGGYDALMPGLAAALFGRRQGGAVRVVVLPVSFSSDPFHISAAERAENLHAAEDRRATMESALQALAPPGVACSVVLAPILTRADAEDRGHLALFGPQVNAIFLLGGDQAVAMRVLMGTPIERALCDLHRRGGVIGGTSAGAAVQSRTMLVGYCDGVDAPHPVEYGVTSIWDQPDRRGLACGQQGVIVDQHFFQRGRIGRLLEAIVRPGSPRIGIGIDAYTGLRLPPDGRIGAVFGRSAVAILDATNVADSDMARYRGVRRSVSVCDVLFHLLAPGPFSYDLTARRHSLAPPLLALRGRTNFTPPAGAGLLLLSGSATAQAEDAALQQRFVAAGAPGRPLLVAALDAGHEQAAQQCAANLFALIARTSPARIDLVQGMDAVLAKLNGRAPYAGVVLAGLIPEGIEAERWAALAVAWRQGAALWLGGAASELAGRWRSVSPPPVDGADPEQIAHARTPRPMPEAQRAGAGLLPVTLQTRLLEDGRWGQLLALADAGRQPALGLGAETTLAVTASGAEVSGAGALFVLDLRQAERRTGENGALVIANGLLDAFAAGDQVTLGVF